MHRSAVIVHDMDQTLRVLKVAAETGVPVDLWSPPSAAGNLGAGVFLSMTDQAMAQVPAADAETVLHCGDDPGYALAALRSGAKRIYLAASVPGHAKVADISRQNDAALVPPAEKIFDAAATADYETGLRQFLEGHAECRTPTASSI